MPFGFNLGFGSDYDERRASNQANRPAPQQSYQQGFAGLQPEMQRDVQGMLDAGFLTPGMAGAVFNRDLEPGTQALLYADMMSGWRAQQDARRQQEAVVGSLSDARRGFINDPARLQIESDLRRRSSPNYQAITRNELQPAYSRIAAGVASGERAYADRLARSGVEGGYAAGMTSQPRVAGMNARAGIEAETSRYNREAQNQALRELAQFFGASSDLERGYDTAIAGAMSGVPTTPQIGFGDIAGLVEGKGLFREQLGQAQRNAQPTFEDILYTALPNLLPLLA